MSEFISNIKFGSVAPVPCNGLCRVSDNCPTCRGAAHRYVEQGIAKLEEFLLGADATPMQHCCECTSDLCPQYRDPRVCKACEDWLHE